MATAKKEVETIVKVKGIVLNLSEEEAKALIAVAGKFTRENNRSALMGNIYNALLVADIPNKPYTKIMNDDNKEAYTLKFGK